MKTYQIVLFLVLLAFLTRCNKEDELAPVIVPNGAEPFLVELGTAYVEPGAKATDNVDGVLDSTAIVIDNSAVNTSIIADYIVHYSINDAAGNPGKRERTVRVKMFKTTFIDTWMVTETDSAGVMSTYTSTIDTTTDSTGTYVMIDNFAGLGSGNMAWLQLSGDFNTDLMVDDSVNRI